MSLTQEQALALGYRNVIMHPDGSVYSMETDRGYRVVRGAPSYDNAVRRAAGITRK
jgi:hypothetical protein